MTRLLALSVCAILVACSQASSSASGDVAPSESGGPRRFTQAVLHDSLLMKSGAAGLVVRLSRAADADPANPTTVRLTTPDTVEIHQQNMGVIRLAGVQGRVKYDLGDFQTVHTRDEGMQQPTQTLLSSRSVDLYGATFRVAPGRYQGIVSRKGYQSQSFDVTLRAGFFDEMELTLIPVPHQ